MNGQIHSTLRPFPVLKKWRPLNLPFDSSALMTGQSLVPVRCGDRTSFIRPEKYAALKALLECSAIPAESAELTDAPCESVKGYDGRLPVGELKENRNGQRFVQLRATEPYTHEEPEQLADSQRKRYEPDDYWTLPPTLAESEEFNPTEWQVVPLPCMPAVPQPPPRAVPNAAEYDTFFIPSVKKRTAAKTGKGQRKFQQKMAVAWADRKRLYQCGEKLLKDVGLNKHSSDVLGPADMRDSCPRCGCSLFVPKSMKKLNCFDCGFEWRYGFTKEASENEQAEGLTEQAVRKVMPRMTAQDFVSTLIVAGKLADLDEKDKRRKLSGTFLQVCHGWIAGDVQKEPDFWHETTETIRKRATRFMRDFKELRKSGNLTPPEGTKEMSLEIP